MEMEQQNDEIQCKICNQIILKPAMLPCKHEFCCYCIRSIKYKHQDKIIVCPLCRRTCQWAPLNKEREKEVIRKLLVRQNIYVYLGKGFAINDVDHNQTRARSFYCVLKGDQLIGDIIWGDGTAHSTYADEVGRGQGKAKLQEDGSLELIDYHFTYSNGPHELWGGIYRYKGGQKFEFENGHYDWQFGNRNSSGKLVIELKEIKKGDTLEDI